MTQELLILLLFGIAAAYVGRMVYRQFFVKQEGAGCAKGCGSCSAIDVDKIAKKAQAAAPVSFAAPKK